MFLFCFYSCLFIPDVKLRQISINGTDRAWYGKGKLVIVA